MWVTQEVDLLGRTQPNKSPLGAPVPSGQPVVRNQRQVRCSLLPGLLPDTAALSLKLLHSGLHALDACLQMIPILGRSSPLDIRYYRQGVNATYHNVSFAMRCSTFFRI